MHPIHHSHPQAQGISRRAMLEKTTSGIGLLALAGMLDHEARADAVTTSTANPLAVRPSHYAAKAKRVIFLFMPGGPSHVDLFDPKPRLTSETGKPLPFEKPKLMRTQTGNMLGTPFKFAKHGQSGIDVSELFPNVASCVDDLCVIRSMVADNINHNGACLQMNTGEQAFCRPSMGAWMLYGLGSENQDLPGYVVISPNQPAQGAPLWGSAFLPAAYQGTWVSDLKNPINNLKSSKFDLTAQREQLDLVKQLNEKHSQERPDESALAARIASFELAFRMQMQAPEAFDIDRESEVTKKLYGIGEPATDIFGQQCLLARRLSERGVRFVQLFHTKSSKASGCQLWDQHNNLKQGLIDNTAATDVPIAGLLKDLKSRGMLEDTLVIWGGEFGRTPTAEGNDGREHHPFGFTMWMAGAGVKKGIIHGATDDFGWHAIQNKVHVHDLHATILHLLGLDHTKLTYRYSGRDFRLTDVYGEVVHDILL
ncbi:MAG TPA: DUF1501 domain-containing protein [Pirellulales bacterium]|nr:DUF1501 domain-containing protein [Pirellulales bacterium]